MVSPVFSNSSFTYTYDNNGNQTQVKSILTGAATNYSYDAQNELVAATMLGGTASYAYDAQGRRVERSSNTATGQPIYYVYDSQDIVAEVDGSGNLIALFTHGPNIDEPLELRQGSGTEYFIHADALGSVIAHTDGTGTVVERVAYEAYGQPVFLDMRSGSPVVESQSFTGDPFAFTGREWDGETRLYFYRARYYDVLVGLFLRRDFIGMSASGYLYVAADPVNLTDPEGLITYVCKRGLKKPYYPPGNFFPPVGSAFHEYFCVDLMDTGVPICLGWTGPPSLVLDISKRNTRQVPRR